MWCGWGAGEGLYIEKCWGWGPGEGLGLTNICGRGEGLDRLAAGRVGAGLANPARALLWYSPTHYPSLYVYLVDISILMLKRCTENSGELLQIQCPSYNFWFKMIINLIHLIEAIYLVVLTFTNIIKIRHFNMSNCGEKTEILSLTRTTQSQSITIMCIVQ